MDERKKLAVVGSLVVAIGAIGAFQFLGGHSSAPVAATKKDDRRAPLPAVRSIPNPQVAENLPLRDPFVPPPSATVIPQAQPKTATGPPSEAKRHHPRPVQEAPQPLPLPGSPTDIQPIGASGAPAKSVSAEPAFGYQVVAVIRGQRSAAILRDPQGNQKLVPVGGAIDGDSKLDSVQDGTVFVNFRGKRLRLSTGGNGLDK